MDTHKFLDEIVRPTIAEYEADRTSLRKAFLACVVTFHTIDYLSGPRKKSGNLRKKFRKESRDFALVDSVAHAFKHVESDGNPGLPVSEIILRPPAIWDNGFTFDLSRWDDEKGGVTLDKDRDIDLLDVLTRSVEFLQTKIKAVETFQD
ncbi:MAG TPA: hypothetical protein VIJ72_06920 [Rhizomicrobium sp.]